MITLRHIRVSADWEESFRTSFWIKRVDQLHRQRRRSFSNESTVRDKIAKLLCASLSQERGIFLGMVSPSSGWEQLKWRPPVTSQLSRFYLATHQGDHGVALWRCSFGFDFSVHVGERMAQILSSQQGTYFRSKEKNQRVVPRDTFGTVPRNLSNSI